MKILISASGKKIDDLLDMRFGRCEYFQIHDMDTKEIKVIENKGYTSEGGAGIAAAQQVIEEKADIIVTGNLGPNAFELINKAGIKVYKCESVSMKLVLEKFSKGELLELKQSGPSHNVMGH